MIRKLMFIVMVCALGAAGFGATVPAGAAPTGTLCELEGTATFSPGLGLTPGQYTYDFTGTLSGCESDVADAPTGGTVSAEGNGVQSGGCAFSLGGAGQATVGWGDNNSPTDTSVISYTTQDVGAGVLVQGQVTAGRYEGNRVAGLLAFQTSTPQDCAVGGLTSATFTGVTSIGDPNPG